MKGWAEAQSAAGLDGRGDPLSGVGAAPPSALPAGAAEGLRVVFSEGLRLASIEMPEAGAILRVTAISRADAMRLARADETEFACAPEYAMAFFEKELNIGELPRARLAPGVRFVIGEKITWRDIRWFLVEYLSDGDGVVP